MKKFFTLFWKKFRIIFDNNSIMLLMTALGIFTITLANISHAYIGSFSRFGADDFCTAGKLNSLGFWNAQSFWYNNWTGRFSFTFFVSVLELFDSRISAVLPILLILFLTISIFVFVNQLSKKLFQTNYIIYSLFITSALVFMVLFTIPNIGQNLYWMTGSITYFLPIILFFLVCSLLVNDRNYSIYKAKRNFNYLIIFFFSFLLGGFSEVMSVLLILLFLLIGFFNLIISKSKKLPCELIPAIIGAFIGLVLMVIAPGNSVRLSNHLPHPTFFALLTNGLVLSSRFIFLWFVKNIHIIWPIITVVIVVGVFLKSHQKLSDFPKQNISKISILFIISSLLLVYISYLPSIWATAKPPVDRVLIFPVVILSCLVILLSLIIGFELGSIIRLDSFKKSPFLKLVLIFVFIYFLLGVPFYQARINFANRAEAKTFAEKWELRETQIADQIKDGKTELLVNMIPTNILNVEHIQEDSGHWINICAAEYYGVDKIIAK